MKKTGRKKKPLKGKTAEGAAAGTESTDAANSPQDDFVTAVRRGPYDCVLLVRSTATAADGPDETLQRRLCAHRAVLCRTAYFEAFFRRTDPDSIETRDPDGERALYGVYSVGVPFAPDTLDAVVRALYDDVDNMPVDALHAAAFLGTPARLTRSIVENAVRRAIADGADSIGDLIVSALQCDAVDAKTMRRIAKRLFGLVDPMKRQRIASTWRIPSRFYRGAGADAKPTTVVDGGVEWHALRLGVDRMGNAKAEITGPNGVNFRVMIKDDYDDKNRRLTCLLIDRIGAQCDDPFAALGDYDRIDSDDDDDRENAGDPNPAWYKCRISIDVYHPLDKTTNLPWRRHTYGKARDWAIKWNGVDASPSRFYRSRVWFVDGDRDDGRHVSMSDLVAFESIGEIRIVFWRRDRPLRGALACTAVAVIVYR
ncbi:hypothetical protein pneo_cds_997 [Pandoravirus neocaledonia]|uniref:BTB domain-containing protein n=1 Tax=Pandoravirus neocaledonia TaxID=2107708 RepID=A0A2U7UDT1_9VIRU|nr:hypothetical protein pneo_cds_997 [Pandoravirus neocaledonia]AVK76604.1 hypothetical protein pneo_cds_997 [Pandoravirus neocaledonia]